MDRQTKLYINRVDIWRKPAAVIQTDGTPTEQAWVKIASNVPCHFKNTDNRLVPEGFLLVQENSLLVTDMISFRGTVDIKAKDCVHKTDTNGSIGFWSIEGDGKPAPYRANKQRTFAIKLEKAPNGIS